MAPNEKNHSPEILILSPGHVDKMSASSKKKALLVACQKCDTLILTKDTARHQEYCSRDANATQLDIAEINKKRTILKGFNTSIEKGSGYLPPDAIGWEKEHSILLNPQTMEHLEVQARAPVRIRFAENSSFIGVVWPCKEVALMKIHVISTRVPRERMITVEKVEKLEKCQNELVVEIVQENENGALNDGIRQFLEMYLSHSYLQYDQMIGVRYLGQQLKIYPRLSLEQKMEHLALGEPPIISIQTGYRLQIQNFEEKSENRKFSKIQDLSEIGGMFEVRRVFENYLLEPIRRKEAPCSILVWGLPGSGKSLVLRKLAAILGAGYVKNCGELAEIVGEPSVIVLDLNEIDKENSKAIKKMGELLENEKICVILSIRSAENLDLGYRVRFPVEAEITVPTQDERQDILQKLAPDLNSEIVHQIVRTTHGFTGGDLVSLLKTAKFSKSENELGKYEEARKRIRPTGIRQFILEVPNVSWNDIGGMRELKLEIQQAVIWPQKHPEAFERFGIDPPAGILLYGPPGCSKTLIARALANEAKMNFLAVKGPELFSKWVGDSEKAIRDLFSRARQVSPTIVFFDEIDAVGSSRGSEKSSGVSDRVLAQLLTELDGLEKTSRVILLAATNRPDQLDSALLRPGRLDRAIHVGLPCGETRRAILEMRTKKMKFENLEQILTQLIDRTEGYSGAELVAVCRTAAMYAMRENIEATTVDWRHFEQALLAVVARTETYLLKIYEDFKAGRFSSA